MPAAASLWPAAARGLFKGTFVGYLPVPTAGEELPAVHPLDDAERN
jgi:hypothetical protein